MKLEDFVKTYELEYSHDRVDKGFLNEVKKKLEVAIGRQLGVYLLNYGYLAYDHIEFLGINSKQLWESDMITKSAKLHQKFEKTRGLLVLEDCGEGVYILVDAVSFVHRFIASSNTLIPVHQDMNTYIMRRIEPFIYNFSCADCVHFKACEDWAKIIFGEGTTFPYRGEQKPCEYYKTDAEYGVDAVKRFMEELKRLPKRYTQNKSGIVSEFISSKDVKALLKKYESEAEDSKR